MNLAQFIDVKKLFIFLVNIYRKFISPYKVPCCKYYPTCSGYAAEAFEKHGALKGLILTVSRLFRCNPWSLGGIDPVPDEFDIFHTSAASRRKYELKKKIDLGKKSGPAGIYKCEKKV